MLKEVIQDVRAKLEANALERERALDETRTALARRDAEILVMQDTIASMRRDAELGVMVEMGEARMELDEMRKELVEARMERDAVREDLRGKKERLREVEQSLRKRLEEEVRRVRVSGRGGERMVERSAGEANAAEDEKAAWKAATERSIEARYRAELDDAREDYEVKIRELRGELTRVEAMRDALEGENSALARRSDALESRLERDRVALEDATSALETRGQLINTLRRRIESVESREEETRLELRKAVEAAKKAMMVAPPPPLEPKPKTPERAVVPETVQTITETTETPTKSTVAALAARFNTPPVSQSPRTPSSARRAALEEIQRELRELA